MEYHSINQQTLDNNLEKVKEYTTEGRTLDFKIKTIEDKLDNPTKNQRFNVQFKQYVESRKKGMVVTEYEFVIIYKEKKYTIQKRFSDFNELRSLLTEYEHCHIIPILLEKGNLIEKLYSFDREQTLKFIEERIKHITYFLSKILLHESLRESEVFLKYIKNESLEVEADNQATSFFGSVWNNVNTMAHSFTKTINGTANQIILTFKDSGKYFCEEKAEFVKMSQKLEVIINYVKSHKNFYDSKFRFEKDCNSFSNEKKLTYKEAKKMKKKNKADETVYTNLAQSSFLSVNKASNLIQVMIWSKQNKSDSDAIVEAIDRLNLRYQNQDALLKEIRKLEMSGNSNSTNFKDLQNRFKITEATNKKARDFHAYEIKKIRESIKKNLKTIFKTLTNTLNKTKF